MHYTRRSSGVDGRESGPACPDPAAIAALEFLERSRDVANERVVDDSAAKPAPSRREEIVPDIEAWPWDCNTSL